MSLREGAASTQGDLHVSEERTWSAAEAAAFADPLLDNAAHFAPHSTTRTDLTLAKVRRNGELIGAAPLLRLVKYRGTRLLKASARAWMDPLFGPFVRKTSCIVDASFMAFRHGDPFLAVDPNDRRRVREAVVAHLKGCPDVDKVMISEPAGDPGWARANGFRPFLQFPLVRVELDGCRTLEDYLGKLGQKRRRNVRQERALFAKEGGAMEVIPPPQAPALLADLHRLLLASSAHNSDLEVPYEDLMNSKPALTSQKMWVIVARAGDAIAGFFAFIPAADVIAQCHGGLDYDHSLRLKAYPNLIHEAVVYALANGFRQVTLGPLNNEAKRRAGELAPVMAALWCRDAVSRWLTNRVLLKRFQVYGGDVVF